MEELFINYEKHNGNITAMSRDNTCVYNSRDPITFYVKKHNFPDRLRHYRTEIIENWKKTHKEMLGTARAALLNRAFELLQDREYDVVSQGQILTAQKPPSSTDIKVAWEIIKSELGEPTKITEKVDPEDENKKLKKVEVCFKNYGDKDKPKQIV